MKDEELKSQLEQLATPKCLDWGAWRKRPNQMFGERPMWDLWSIDPLVVVGTALYAEDRKEWVFYSTCEESRFTFVVLRAVADFLECRGEDET